MDDENIEDGSTCNQDGCGGIFSPAKAVNCSCHISAPCSSCVNAGYVCDKCGHDTTPYREEYHDEPPPKKLDRSSETTSTRTSGPFNSTPFTRCCGAAAIGTKRCPSCNAEILYHNDGLAERRRWANGGCLMCGKPHGDISISGNCNC